MLMQNQNTKSPSYIKEKMNIINFGYFAIQALDNINQQLVFNYLKEWKFEIPEEVKKII